jgi:hypothetical protein
MKLTDKQVAYIKGQMRDLDIFLAGKPRIGEINAKLQKQWYECILGINDAA